MSARDRILSRVRRALESLDAAEHPGSFQAWRPHGPPASSVDTLTAMLRAAGAEVERLPTAEDAERWLTSFCASFESAVLGETLPEGLRPSLPVAAPEHASLGVSMARAAAGETGSLLLDARDGRRAQLLPPVHVVFVRAETVYAELRDALLAVRDDLPSAIGLHSGPSKSADIGHVMVQGVHGPGRLVTVVIGV